MRRRVWANNFACCCMCVCVAQLVVGTTGWRRRQEAGFPQFATISLSPKHSTLQLVFIILLFISYFALFSIKPNISSFAPVVVNFCINKVKNCTTVTATLCPLTSARAAVSFTTNCICKRTANEYAKTSRERL